LHNARPNCLLLHRIRIVRSPIIVTEDALSPLTLSHQKLLLWQHPSSIVTACPEPPS
jgi:hypothetical protein